MILYLYLSSVAQSSMCKKAFLHVFVAVQSGGERGKLQTIEQEWIEGREEVMNDGAGRKGGGRK